MSEIEKKTILAEICADGCIRASQSFFKLPFIKSNLVKTGPDNSLATAASNPKWSNLI